MLKRGLRQSFSVFLGQDQNDRREGLKDKTTNVDFGSHCVRSIEAWSDS